MHSKSNLNGGTVGESTDGVEFVAHIEPRVGLGFLARDLRNERVVQQPHIYVLPVLCQFLLQTAMRRCSGVLACLHLLRELDVALTYLAIGKDLPYLECAV